MREYPALLRQAVSLGRRLQDPLLEFAQLCNADDDILCLHYHPLQVRAVPHYALERLDLCCVDLVEDCKESNFYTLFMS